MTLNGFLLSDTLYVYPPGDPLTTESFPISVPLGASSGTVFEDSVMSHMGLTELSKNNHNLNINS